MAPWHIEYTKQFADWHNRSDDDAQEDLDVVLRLLEAYGPALTRPHADTVNNSRHSNMRELRVQSKGRPLRVFYAFDQRRIAILLIGGDKTGISNERFYRAHVRVADRLYDEHLESTKRKKPKNGS
jgi:hypothetical protein